MFKSIRKSLTETPHSVSVKPRKTWSQVPKNALDKTMKLIYLRSILAVNNQSIYQRLSLLRQSWSLKIPTKLREQSLKLLGILNQLLTWESVLPTLCWDSSKCHQRCHLTPTSGIWIIQTSQKGLYNPSQHYVLWCSITKTVKLL